MTNTINVASYIFAWVPGVFLLGRVADLVNAGIYTMEGNYLQAGLTGVTALVPLAGKALSLGAAAVGEASGLADTAAVVAESTGSDNVLVNDVLDAGAGTEEEVTFFKAPQRGRDPIPELMNGFNPAEYPGDGPYFATDKSLASEFESSYQNGIQQFTMPTQDFNNLVDRGIIQEYFAYPGRAFHVPAVNLNEFNEAIMR